MREVVLKRRGGAGGPPQLQSLVLLQNQADLLLVLLLLLERSRAERRGLLLGQSLRVLLPAGSQRARLRDRKEPPTGAKTGVPEQVLVLELLQLVQVEGSELLLPLQSLLVTVPLSPTKDRQL